MHHVALDRAGADDRDLDDQVVEALRPQARQHGHLRPALDLEDAERIGPLQHVVDGRVLARDRWRASSRRRRAGAAGRSALRMQVSMPSASTSTFMMPSASISSLSHSMKVRSSIAALPIGTISSRRPRVSTKPPTCCDRWRGKAEQLLASSTARRDHRVVRDRARPGAPASRRGPCPSCPTPCWRARP